MNKILIWRKEWFKILDKTQWEQYKKEISVYKHEIRVRYNDTEYSMENVQTFFNSVVERELTEEEYKVINNIFGDDFNNSNSIERLISFIRRWPEGLPEHLQMFKGRKTDG